MIGRFEVTLPAIVTLLLGAGVLTLSTAAPDFSFVQRQLIFAGGGAAAFVLLLVLGRNRIYRFTWPFYWLSVGLLIATLLFGSEINGAKSWLKLGPLPAFQPSEFAKISLLLALSAALHEKPITNIWGYFRPAFLMLLPFGLVFLEPDLGSALVLAAIGGGILLVRGLPWRHVLAFVILFVVAVPFVVWPNLQPHQRARIVAFANPDADPQGSGFQVIQSRIAIGSGGVWGKGYKQGTQAQNGFIPLQYADFIYSVLAEEGGLVASAGLLLLYALLFWRLLAMAVECPQDRDQLAIVGVVSLIGFQVIVNVGVTIGLAPVTGVTLPLISYGGTSLLSTLIAISLAYVIHRDRYKNGLLGRS